MPPSDRFLKGTAARIGETGRKAEKHLTKRLGGRACIGSGNQAGDKGDVNLPEYLVEAKATEADSYSIKLDLLAKITREARAKQKYPAFAVTFVTGNGRPKPFGSWVMVPEHVFNEMQLRTD